MARRHTKTAAALTAFAAAACITTLATGHAAADPAGGYPAVPANYAAAADQAAKTCTQITAPTLTALLYTQSEFGAHTEGASGALGPAQLFDRDFATYGADDNGDGRADVNDPLEATMALSRLLCTIAKDVDAEHPNAPSYSGSPDAQKAYLTKFNAGTTNPPPNTETPVFVAKVTAAAAHYAAAAPANNLQSQNTPAGGTQGGPR